MSIAVMPTTTSETGDVRKNADRGQSAGHDRAQAGARGLETDPRGTVSEPDGKTDERERRDGERPQGWTSAAEGRGGRAAAGTS
jgi:hypothetical protein